MKGDRWRPWSLGIAYEMAEKGLGPEEIGVYFALGNDPHTGISGVVLNADLVRAKLGLSRKTWNRILNRLAKTGFLIPSRDVRGVFLIPGMSAFACRNPNQYLHAFRSIQGLPEDIVSAWMGLYRERVPETVPETKRDIRDENKGILRKGRAEAPRPENPSSTSEKDVKVGGDRAPRAENPGVKGLVASFAERWKARNPGAPFQGGAALGKFLKSALRELERAGSPDPPGTIGQAIEAWFNAPPDLHSYAMAVSWGWEGFIKKYPELIRRIRYDERPKENSIRRL